MPAQPVVKHRIAELEGALLDAAVARALGSDGSPLWDPPFPTGPNEDGMFGDGFKPSTRWDHGGPIIDREPISVVRDGNGRWVAYVGDWLSPAALDEDPPHGAGATALIAAMRAYVANKFGAEVELPTGT